MKLILKLLSLFLVFATSFSLGTGHIQAQDSEKSPVITDFTANMFIRSDGSVRVISGRQLIPTQVEGISNAVKILADGFVLTADGKSFALRNVENVTKAFELPITAEIKKVKNDYLLDDENHVYQYFTNIGGDPFVEKLFKIPFKVKDLFFSYYSTTDGVISVFVFLTEDGELWARDSISNEFTQIGSGTYISLNKTVLIDEQGTVWRLYIHADEDIDYSLNSFHNSKKVAKAYDDYSSVIAITEHQEAVLLTEVYFGSIQTVNNRKILQISGSNGNYYYLTEDYKLYRKSMDKSTLIAENVIRYDEVYSNYLLGYGGIVYQYADGSLGAWPSTNVQIKNEVVNSNPNLANTTGYNIQDPISVKVNNKVIGMPKGAWLINDTTYLPLRSIFTNLGATVNWNQEQKIASLSTVMNGDAKHIMIDFKKQKVMLNDEELPFEQELFIADASAYVPLRLVSEGLGATVTWNPNTKEIQISTNEVK